MTRQQLINALLFLSTLHLAPATFAQISSPFADNPGNSFKAFFDKNDTAIHYSYSDAKQTHNYSGNWDFDGDGDVDSLYFIGTGGAHLYFFLRIILSADKKVRDFPFIELDQPLLEDVDQMKKSAFFPPPVLPQFVVDKFYTGSNGENTRDKIYVHLEHLQDIPLTWRKQGVNSTYLILSYQKGDMIIKNFIQ